MKAKLKKHKPVTRRARARTSKYPRKVKPMATVQYAPSPKSNRILREVRIAFPEVTTPLAAEVLVERGGEYDEYGGLTFVEFESPLGDYLRALADARVTLAQVQNELACIRGSLAAQVITEREEYRA